MASPTPQLDHLLVRLSRRLTGLIWLHGLATALCALALWTLFCFCADWFLHVPAPVRWLHLLVWLGAPLWLFYRELLRPLRRRPDPAGLAVLVERAHGELDQLLVSAVELDCGGREARGRELVYRVRAKAEARVAELNLTGVLDTRGPCRRLGAAALALMAVGALFSSYPNLAAIFASRLFGAATPWPQRTHLTVEVPLMYSDELPPMATSGASAEDGRERLELRVSRGTDVPVHISARGQVPAEVLLVFGSGEHLTLGSGGAERFSTVLRSVQQDISFRAYGGDDQDGEPLVSITVLSPPDVSDLALVVEPPAYSGLPTELLFRGDAEVLAGSRLTVHARLTPPGSSGHLRLLPADSRSELVPAAFPPRPEAAKPANAPAAAVEHTSPAGQPRPGETAVSAEFLALSALRYRFELSAPDGMRDPDPGLFAVEVIEDRAPELALLLPGRAEVDLVPGGRLPLFVRATDDFGLARMSWTASVGNAVDGERGGLELVATPLAGETRAWGGGALLSAVDLAAAAGGEGEGHDDATPQEGQIFLLTARATDNREPEPGIGTSAHLRVRITGPDEFLRRVQDRLARARLTTTGLVRLWSEKLTQLRALESVLDAGSDVADGDAAQAADWAEPLAGALTGGRRLATDARSLTRDLAAIAQDVLYAGIDERAAPLMEAWHRAGGRPADRAFHAQPWRELARGLAAGRFGAPEFAGQLVELTELALLVSEEAAPAGLAALEDAAAHAGADRRRRATTLAAAVEAQEEGLVALERLGARLAEWDNFQSVLSLTRDILNRQRNLIEHTRVFARDR